MSIVTEMNAMSYPSDGSGHVPTRVQREPSLVRSSGVQPKEPSSSICGRIWRVYSDAMDESGSMMKGFFKLMGVGAFWVKYFNPNAPKACGHLGTISKNAKNITSVIEWPIRLEKLKKSITSFNHDTPFKSAANVGSEICSVINNGSDTLEFVNALHPVPNEVMERVKVANSAATLFSSVKGAFDTVGKISGNLSILDGLEEKKDHISTQKKTSERSKTYSKITSNLMSLVTKVCYAALGALGLISLAVPVAPAAMVGLLTVGTVLGLANLFYDRIVDPNDDRAKKLAQNPLFDSAMEYSQRA